jgi:hypothetical protein
MVQEVINDSSTEIVDESILTEEKYKRLDSMFGSHDPGDHKMGQLILNKVNVEKSIYWIWKLAKSHCGRLVNLRTKDSRKLNEACSIYTLAYARETEFGHYLINKGWMTPEIFIKLKSGIQGETKYHVRNDKFFEFSVELKPQHKYLDPTDTLTKL